MIYLKNITVWLLAVGCSQAFLMEANGEEETAVTYQLYTRGIEGVIKMTADGPTIGKSSGFNPQTMTYFIIHGWHGGDLEGNWEEKMKDALLNMGDVNVIFVSWKVGAQTINYIDAKSRTGGVGRNIAKFIEYLEKKYGASRQKMHLIGHSLGGQVAGFAGAALQNPVKIARITGLDTSGAAFNCFFDKDDCLDPLDADFVDEIHSLVSLSGLGHADFYPIPSNPIKVLLDTKLIGSHFLACDYFTKSIEAGPCAFQAVQCDSAVDFKMGKCLNNKKNNLGFYATKPASHQPVSYYLDIDINKPCPL